MTWSWGAFCDAFSVSCRQYNFRFAEDGTEITGYAKNAVTPLGMKRKMPIILASDILELRPKHFWLGGGEVDLKWRVDVDDFVHAIQPFVAPITFA